MIWSKIWDVLLSPCPVWAVILTAIYLKYGLSFYVGLWRAFRCIIIGYRTYRRMPTQQEVNDIYDDLYPWFGK